MQASVVNKAYICMRCLWRQGRRGFATTSSTSTSTPDSNSLPPTPPSAPPPAPPPSGAARLTTRRLISLHGPDAPRFLQGIITNNVRPASPSGFFAAFLTAQGKVLNDVFVYPTHNASQYAHTASSSYEKSDPGYLVEVDASSATLLLAHLKRHKLRAKLGLRLLEEDELYVWSTWKAQDKWTPHFSPSSTDNTTAAAAAAASSDQSLNATNSSEQLPNSIDNNNNNTNTNILLTDTRAPGMGRRILLPSTTNLSTHPLTSSLPIAPLSAYTIRRYLRGVPEGQSEIPRDGAFPMNVNLDIMDAIDFKKGCYVGQELTIRTHHTGVVRRRILPVSLYDITAAASSGDNNNNNNNNNMIPQSSQSPPVYDPTFAFTTPGPDAEIAVAVGNKRQKPGKWVAGIGNVGLAICRVEIMTDLVVTGEPVGYTPESRFVVKVEGEEEVGVKAFVPDWIRGKVRTAKVQKRVE